MTKYRNRDWVESLPDGQNAGNVRASDSLFNENHSYRNTRFEV